MWVRFELDLRAAGVKPDPVPVVDDAGALLPEALARARDHRPPRHGARHRPPVARRDLHARRRRGRGRREDDRRHPPRVPVAAHLRPADQVELAEHGRADGARVHDALHGQVHVGAGLRGDARGRRRSARRGRPTSARSSTRRSRTGWRSWPTCSSRPGSATRRSARWRSTTRAGWPGRMSRRIQVIGAHSADFVWRSGGAIAKAVELGGDGRGHRAVLRRARRVGRAVEGGGPDDRERQAAAPRRGRGGRRRTSARAFRCLDLGDYPLQIDGDALLRDRRRDPRVRARRARHPHRHRPVQPRPPGRLRRGQPGARAGRRRRRAERLCHDQAAGAVPVRAPPARAVQLHADDPSSTSRR